MPEIWLRLVVDVHFRKLHPDAICTRAINWLKTHQKHYVAISPVNNLLLLLMTTMTTWRRDDDDYNDDDDAYICTQISNMAILWTLLHFYKKRTDSTVI